MRFDANLVVVVVDLLKSWSSERELRIDLVRLNGKQRREKEEEERSTRRME